MCKTMPRNYENELLSELGLSVIALRSAEHLIGLIKQYYDSIKNPEGFIIDDPNEFAQKCLKSLEQRTVTPSSIVSIDKENYLAAIIQSKIEIIALIGDFKLIKMVYDELILHEKWEPGYPLAEIFSVLATGIGGWSA